MISGVNFIDLNHKNRKKQQQIDKMTNKQRSTVIRDHINYIGRIKGTVNNSEHSLFGTLADDDNVYSMKKQDILSYIKSKVKNGAYVYRTVLSMTQEDCEKYGYTTRESWENLIRSNINTIADEYNIRLENLDWVASLHTEEGHIHTHLVFYDNSNTRKVAPFVKFDKIRQKLNYTAYRKDIQPLLDSKNTVKKDIKVIFKDNIDDIVVYDKNSIFYNKIDEKDINEIAKLLRELYELKDTEYKETGKGSWKMAYQSEQVKEKLRAITIKIIESSSQIKREVDTYINACIEMEKIRNTNNHSKYITKQINNTIQKETEFILRKIDNQILDYLKETKYEMSKIEFELNRKQFDEAKYNKMLSRILDIRTNNLLTDINSDLKNFNDMHRYFNKKTIVIPQTKRAKREWALKNRDVGMIDWEMD